MSDELYDWGRDEVRSGQIGRRGLAALLSRSPGIGPRSPR